MAGVHNMMVGSGARTPINITISANTQNYVLNTAKATGYQPGSSDITLTINSGIIIGSSSTGGIAFDIDTSWNANDQISIIVGSGAYISGCGGAGGAGALVNASNDTPGGAGGAALRAQRAVSITNNGTIQGGGGGGGGATSLGGCCGLNYGSGGGGGAGNSVGAGGVDGVGTTYSNNGTLTAGGTGAPYAGSTGGTGGSPGAAGATGGGNFGSPSAGGAGGNCTTSGSNANITWLTTGTRLGTIA